MGPKIQTLAGLFGVASNLVPLALSDVKEEDFKKRTRGGEGPSMAWLLGHLLHYRYLSMNMLGGKTESPYGKTYSEESATDGASYPNREEFLSKWAATQKEFESVLGSSADEELDRPVGGDSPHGEKKVIEMVTFFGFHEGYHMGSIGAMRKEFGYSAISDLVMAQMAQGK